MCVCFCVYMCVLVFLYTLASLAHVFPHTRFARVYVCSNYVVIFKFNSSLVGYGVQNVWTRDVGVFRPCQHEVGRLGRWLSDPDYTASSCLCCLLGSVVGRAFPTCTPTHVHTFREKSSVLFCFNVHTYFCTNRFKTHTMTTPHLRIHTFLNEPSFYTHDNHIYMYTNLCLNRFLTQTITTFTYTHTFVRTVFYILAWLVCD